MADLPKIYIEACPFINMAKHRAKMPLNDEGEHNVWFTKQLIQAAKDGKIEILTSSISIVECTHIPNVSNPSEDIKRFYDGLLASGKAGIKLVQPTFTIMEKARSLRWVDGIYLKGAADAIHVASALHMNCAEFITVDGGILKKHEKLQDLNLKACKPRETDILPPEYRQDDMFKQLDS